MKKILKYEKKRTISTISNDKMSCPTRFSEMIKSEVFFVLSNYFELDKSTFFTFIDLDENCFLDIKIVAKAKKMRDINLASINILES